ncbi:stage III sporulation protein AD [Bacillaceae bacterium S4-13-58]
MGIIEIISFALIATVLYIIVKDQKPSIAFFIILLAGVLIFLSLLEYITDIFSLLDYLAQKANIDGVYLETILKIIGIAYIAEFAAQIVRDAGLGSVAGKIELAGKIFILTLAVPILTAVIETILGMMPV